MFRTLALAALPVALAFPMASQADLTWNFASGTSSQTTFTSGGGSGGLSGVAATITGLSATNDNDLAVRPTIIFGGGIGINSDGESTSSPDHAVDNNGAREMVLFSFAAAIKLTEVRAGWWNTDSDISVLAYTGGSIDSQAAMLGDVTNRSWSELTSNGWSLVGHYSNIETSTRNVNPAGVQSSFWLVGAYTSHGWRSWLD